MLGVTWLGSASAGPFFIWESASARHPVASPSPWMWTFIFPHHEGRSPTHDYAATREAAMAAFAKSWREGISGPTDSGRKPASVLCAAITGLHATLSRLAPARAAWELLERSATTQRRMP